MPSADTFEIRCQCGARLRVPAAAEGRRVKCPKCEFRMVVQKPEEAEFAADPARAPSKPVSPPAAPPPPPPSDDEPLLEDLLSAEQSAETSVSSNVADKQTICPSCSTPMAKGATSCLACGGGSSAMPAREVQSKVGAGMAKSVAYGKKFTLGCVLSAAGALIGAGVWYFIAIKTGFEIGYIAWGVGLAAGFGMVIGYGGEGFMASLVATTMAAGGIMAAKLLIYNSLAGPSAIADAQDHAEVAMLAYSRCDARFDAEGAPPFDTRRDTACDGLSDDMYDAEGSEFTEKRDELFAWRDADRWSTPTFARDVLVYEQAMEEWDGEDESWQEAYDEAVLSVDAMSDDDKIARAKTVIENREEAALAVFKGLLEVEISQNAGFWGTMFSPIDALFVLLALGTAMKVGGGSEAE